MAETSTPPQATRIALVGAGFIARVHLQVLARMRGTSVVAICDSDRRRAEQVAREHGIARVFESVEELLEVFLGEVDVVHLLVPPPLHFELAKKCLCAGLHVLVEKPLARTPEEAVELGEVAAAHGVQVGVNHNLVFDPNVVRLRRELRSGRLGRLEHLNLVHHVPLRQLQTGDTAHFMFRSEANILLEQGVHPFSLVCDLLGPQKRVTAHVRDPQELPCGRFFDTWMVAIECERGTAQVLLALGRTMQEIRLEALCTDAAVRIDLVRGTWQRSIKTRWLEVVDMALDGIRRGLGLVGQGVWRVVRYALALFRLAPASEPFLRAMRASLGGFHLALRQGRPVPNGPLAAAEVLRVCRETARAAGASEQESALPEVPSPGPARPDEVVVTGGAGFLGRHVVAKLLDAGRNVTLLLRRPDRLAPGLLDRGVRVFVGDVTEEAVLARAVAGAKILVHMATCAGAMARSVAMAVSACRHAGLQRLVYISSTAALYLGEGEIVPGDVDPDPLPEERSAYAREKIAAENELRSHLGEGLEILCLRPGIVVGPGGVLEHTGVGLWTRDNHCVGWGRGLAPLPFVLVEDCADAVLRAVTARAAVIAGKRYNLAGDVRPTAREYVAALHRATGRPYHFHPQSTWWLWAMEQTKYLIKRLARRPATRLSLRDLRSRAFLSALDTSDVKRDLGWQPVADKEVFWRRALGHIVAGSAPAPVAEAETETVKT